MKLYIIIINVFVSKQFSQFVVRKKTRQTVRHSLFRLDVSSYYVLPRILLASRFVQNKSALYRSRMLFDTAVKTRNVIVQINIFPIFWRRHAS